MLDIVKSLSEKESQPLLIYQNNVFQNVADITIRQGSELLESQH